MLYFKVLQHFLNVFGQARGADEPDERFLRQPGVMPSRMARSLDRWRNLAPALQPLVRRQLERVAAEPGLSGDVGEIVGRALA